MPACLTSKGCGNYGQARRPAPPILLTRSHSPTRSQVALGKEAAKRLSLIVVFIERNNARPVGVPGRVGVHRVAGIEAGAGTLLLVLIPEIAALPDAMAQAGEGADGGGVVSQHILRIMAGSARPTF